MSIRKPSLLVLNPGSSTLKFGCYRALECIDHGTIEWRATSDREENQRTVRGLISRFKDPFDGVVFRVVHGGMEFVAPTVIDESVLDRLEKTVALAPLHQPPALAAMRAAKLEMPRVLQIACFDTAFHATLPEEEKRLPIPNEWYDQGVRRYGFHGLSYESIAGSLPNISQRAAMGRTVVCHLGNGCSLCGMRACQSSVTSMSFTPLDGIIMGTRSGRIDAGVPLHWMRMGWDADRIERLLTKESGLLGLSERFSDMRPLLEARREDPKCDRAIAMFCRSVAREIASAATALGGLDAIVFTAGIGEHCPSVRAEILDHLSWMGVRMDAQANEDQQTFLHAKDSSVEVMQIGTDEQTVLAKHGLAMLSERDGKR